MRAAAAIFAPVAHLPSRFLSSSFTSWFEKLVAAQPTEQVGGAIDRHENLVS